MFREAIVEGVTVDAFVTRSLRATGTSDLLESVNQWQLAQALNPPIKVTQAVLDAMEKVHEAKFRTQEKCPATASPIYYLCFYEGGGGTWEKGWHYWTPSDYSIFGKFNKVEEGDYIQADCPLALQVLLGFTVEGVPKDD
jgi:hypothetical protein